MLLAEGELAVAAEDGGAEYVRLDQRAVYERNGTKHGPACTPHMDAQGHCQQHLQLSVLAYYLLVLARLR